MSVVQPWVRSDLKRIAKHLGVVLAACVAAAGIILALIPAARASVSPGELTDSDGNTIRVLAGTLRQDSPGSGWYLIGGGHTALNLTIQSVSSDRIVLATPTASKIITAMCGPDETYAQLGYTCGISADYSTLTIKIGHNGAPVDPTQLSAGPWANLWISTLETP